MIIKKNEIIQLIIIRYKKKYILKIKTISSNLISKYIYIKLK